MTSLEQEKLATEKFIENAVTNERNDQSNGYKKTESSKIESAHILKESEDQIYDGNMLDCVLDSSLLKSINSEADSIEGFEDLTSSNLSTIDAKEIESKGSSDEEKPNTNTSNLSENSSNTPDIETVKEEWSDLLGSGVILKKIRKEGEPDTRPKRSDRCFIKYTCRLEDADENNFVEQSDNFEMCLGEGDVIQGLDVAVGLMNKYECCILKIQSRLAFGDKGSLPLIPAKATVVYDVELLDVKDEEEFDNLTTEDRQKIGNKKRERGNWWYQRGENTLAVQCYRRALDFLDEVETERDAYKPTDSQLQALLEDRLKVLNNMASAQIKMELYDQALVSLQTVLRCQPENVKALYRKAKIHIGKNDLHQALQLLEKAKSIEPNDCSILKEINNVNSRLQKQKSSEREYARRMFGGPLPAPSKKEFEKKEDKKKNSQFSIWSSLGATVILGLAGFIAYKMKYT
ncbi:peptidyl-prolyl cis-trans isomerase FKBP8-like [Sitophilus oryzae]|uniref:peptidylprolyl isomerase n=1 Tax=Sitophilus oryzae TaxID=7048 RepID=A0A6J2X3W3_SITOR|nr:peptidyl-prolyl cis-trans isomerase FKBP8-like [Sitophilus oryzae]XP_030745629.1 peptidyl-prolyl cis-trans isomerase FKBP8-like [Sitophilus oryzae]XP_030745637.1 peptidyl-prolyl cis-trans isomerase FKBP8-like [Sitophilus oryzae]